MKDNSLLYNNIIHMALEEKIKVFVICGCVVVWNMNEKREREEGFLATGGDFFSALSCFLVYMIF